MRTFLPCDFSPAHVQEAVQMPLLAPQKVSSGSHAPVRGSHGLVSFCPLQHRFGLFGYSSGYWMPLGGVRARGAQAPPWTTSTSAAMHVWACLPTRLPLLLTGRSHYSYALVWLAVLPPLRRATMTHVD